MAQASAVLSHGEVASAVQVPAKDAGVQDVNGMKTVELMDPTSAAKPASTIDDQLPSLLSLVIDGLPPLQQSKYVHEAEKLLHQLWVKRYPHASSLSSYCRVGLSVASYLHPEVISLDRLVAISTSYTLWFLLDDLFFDTPTEFLLDQYGISCGALGSPQKIQESLDHLDAIFSQQVQPSNPTPLIETLMWESGRLILELSNPEWFRDYVACIVQHHYSGITSHADIIQGHNSCFQDVESYAVMRAANVGGQLVLSAIEFTNNSYIPSKLKVTPYMENIIMTASIHVGFANDIFSYHKESSIEQNPRNLITVLMECEEKPFVQTLHMAIGLTNTYARVVMDLEAEAWNSTLRKYLQDVKALIAGNVHFSACDDRYRQRDSIFPELRDTTSCWKIVPHAKGPGL